MHISNNIDPEWMRPGEIAKKFGVSRPTVYEWIKKRYIRSASFKEQHQRHGTRLIEVKSVRDYIEKHAVGPRDAEPDPEASLDA
jgi:excisionase family DNA binding protein